MELKDSTRLALFYEIPLQYASLAFRFIASGPAFSYARPRISRQTAALTLFYVAALGDVIAMEKILKSGIDPDSAWRGYTPLMAAAMENQFWAAKHLLKSKADANKRHPSGLTAILCAIRNRNSRLVELLLAFGASPKATVHGDLEPFALAKLSGNEFVMELITKALRDKRRI